MPIESIADNVYEVGHEDLGILLDAHVSQPD
jgi:hypothetical protein